MNPSSPPADPSATPAVRAALARLLRPAIRLAIRHGLMFPAFAELLKEVYVDVAARDFALPDKGATDSRVTLLTGVHRKDVRRLRETRAGLRDAAAPRSVSLGAQIAAAWSARSDCIDADGRPKPLPRAAADPAVASFESLVQSVSKDIRPRAVLDEWTRLGVVDVDATADTVALRADAFVPADGFVEKTFYVGQNVHDHLAAAAHNLDGGQPPMLERCVHYAHVPAAAVPELAALAETTGMKALRAVNARIRSGTLPRTAAAPDQRVNFGIWFFAEPMDAAAAAATADEADGDAR